MPDTYTADCSAEDLKKLAKDRGGWLTLDGADYVLDADERLTLHGVEAGETVPMKKASREAVALVTGWFRDGSGRAGSKRADAAHNPTAAATPALPRRRASTRAHT